MRPESNRLAVGPVLESFEPRRMMAAAAVLTAGGRLLVHGTDAADVIHVTGAKPVADGASTVRAGTTSVTLDTALLKSAAGLTLTGAATTGRPAKGGFLVGFPILTTSDLTYKSGPFAPVSGTIRHSGTVTFNGNVTVGDFDIGYDARRATAGRSGFYVASTVGIKAILFDLAPPSSLAATPRALDIGRADLKVSPEFAAFLKSKGLAKSDLAGAVAGAARSDSVATTSTAGVVAVSVAPRGRPNDVRRFSFHAAKVKSIEVYAGGGSDVVGVSGVVLTGKLLLSTAGGADTVGVSGVFADRAAIDTGSHGDTLAIQGSGFASFAASLGGGNDRLTSGRTLYTGDRLFGGGSGDDGASADAGVTADDFFGVESLSIA